MLGGRLLVAFVAGVPGGVEAGGEWMRKGKSGAHFDALGRVLYCLLYKYTSILGSAAQWVLAGDVAFTPQMCRQMYPRYQTARKEGKKHTKKRKRKRDETKNMIIWFVPPTESPGRS